LQAVSDSCCPGPRRCEHLPSSCSASCRLRFVPFMTHCATLLPRQDLTEFRQFLPLCKAPPPPPPPAPMLCSDGRQLVAAQQQVSSDCCSNGNCVQLPSSCSGRCKSTFVTFMTYCQAQLSSAVLAQYRPFLQLCRAPPAPTPRLCNDNKTTYTEALDLVSTNCCSGPNDCASGRHLPSSCSASCRSIFVPFMTHCAALLPPQLQTNFTQFLPSCKALPPPPPPTPEPQTQHQLPSNHTDHSTHGRRLKDGDARCADGRCVVIERDECIESTRRSHVWAVKAVFAVLLLLKLGVAYTARRVHLHVSDAIHKNAVALWGSERPPSTTKKDRASFAMEMSPLGVQDHQAAAAAAAAAAPVAVGMLAAVHPVTGKRQIKAAAAPNHVSRTRSIFERYAIDAEDGEKRMNFAQFSHFSEDMAEVVDRDKQGDAHAIRYKMTCATCGASHEHGLTLNNVRICCWIRNPTSSAPSPLSSNRMLPVPCSDA
jgi:hypothetical protein